MKKRTIWLQWASGLLTGAAAILLLQAALVERRSDVPYEYPIQPGTPEWLSLTPRERYRACFVDRYTAEGLTTEALAETVLTYPYLVKMYAYSTRDQGIEALCRSFPALEVLFERPDAPGVLGDCAARRALLGRTPSEQKAIHARALLDFLTRRS